jgi:glyoxylase-like metal-dependent hydrolase (beta-lactamase superfamily II)
MADVAEQLLEWSSQLVDGGGAPAGSTTQPMDARLADFGDGLALVASFSHVVVLRSRDGLTLVDTSSEAMAGGVQASLRRWSPQPVDTIVYTHGHMDHVGGAPRFAEEARTMGAKAPRVIAHDAVAGRFSRYEETDGFNARINARQFGRIALMQAAPERWSIDWVWPTETYAERLEVELAGRPAVLHHDRGETDDHTWVWLPERKTILGGDFITWVFPNAGNPQKVQRYPAEWARALHAMAALSPELYLPAHGLPIEGRDRIARVLSDVARALESLVDQTLALMNAGAPLDEILHSVAVPRDLADRPYLQATYDEPEFVVRNIWRLYGGWWDGDAANLKPAPAAKLAAEIASLTGGAGPLMDRALLLSQSGEHRLACHLADFAVRAEETPERHAQRAEVYRARRDDERSLMAIGVFRDAAEESAARARAEA